jgi:anaerobic ribonucleoside-triphosphate reductase activating protein
MNWELNKIQYPIYNLGPGKRIGIWVQGCSIRCKSCINSSLWENGKGKQVSIPALFEIVNLLGNDFDGITITGGEPFDDYPQLMAFATLIKRKTALHILCYTGYYLHELESKFPDKAFYTCIDTLIDGPYDKDQPASESDKGSDNQTRYNIINGKPTETDQDRSEKIWSLKCTNNTVYMAGIPAKNEMKTINQNLMKDGIHLKLI